MALTGRITVDRSDCMAVHTPPPPAFKRFATGAAGLLELSGGSHLLAVEPGRQRPPTGRHQYENENM